MDLPLEHELRACTFRWLEQQVARHGDVLQAALLKQGFEFRGHRVPLSVWQGIHKPRMLQAALSIRTSFDSPYADHFDGEDTLVYSYQGTDPRAWDNQSLRRAYEHQLPLVYLHAVGKHPSRYLALWPVFVVGDDPAGLSFQLQTELPALTGPTAWAPGTAVADPRSPERSYGTRLARTRLHQASFRERVLSAYRQQCAMCRFKHPRLLDAAHIIPDADPLGEPVVTNGLSLCRIHHGAFDVHYLSVDPSTYRIQLRPDLLEEEDGPMLLHGLQELHGTRILLPRRAADRPDPERLKVHWQAFQDAC